jgi:heat shock protein HtpX
MLGRGRDDREGVNPLLAIVAMIAAPLAAGLIQMAVSRSREYGADASGARLVGYPDGLANALRKLQAAAPRIPLQNANPSTAHLFIVNPFSGRSLTKLFSTHPPLEERVERLMAMKTQPW